MLGLKLNHVSKRGHLWPRDAICRYRSGGIKVVHGPMLTNHRYSSVTLIWRLLYKRYLNHTSLNIVCKFLSLRVQRVDTHHCNWILSESVPEQHIGSIIVMHWLSASWSIWHIVISTFLTWVELVFVFEGTFSYHYTIFTEYFIRGILITTISDIFIWTTRDMFLIQGRDW